jgi:hypothetical protein
LSHNPGADCHFRRQMVTAATIPKQNATIMRLSRLSHGYNRRQYLQHKYRLYREITYNMNNCHRLSDCHFASRVVGDNRILPYPRVQLCTQKMVHRHVPPAAPAGQVPAAGTCEGATALRLVPQTGSYSRWYGGYGPAPLLSSWPGLRGGLVTL